MTLRFLSLAGVLSTLAACGLNQNSFGTEFVETYCAEHRSCDRIGRPCPVELNDQGTVYRDCDFDKDLAAECLDGAFTCDDSIPENAVVIVPEACTLVCGDVSADAGE